MVKSQYSFIVEILSFHNVNVDPIIMNINFNFSSLRKFIVFLPSFFQLEFRAGIYLFIYFSCLRKMIPTRNPSQSKRTNWLDDNNGNGYWLENGCHQLQLFNRKLYSFNANNIALFRLGSSLPVCVSMLIWNRRAIFSTLSSIRDQISFGT